MIILHHIHPVVCRSQPSNHFLCPLDHVFAGIMPSDAMHHFICGHAPYHHGILSADPVSLPTAGVFNCRVELFAHLQIKHSFEKEKSTWEMKLP